MNCPPEAGFDLYRSRNIRAVLSNKSQSIHCVFAPVWVKSGSGRMTKEMRPFFEKRKWNDKRDTPAAAPPPCRLHFLMFSALHAEKAALLRRKNAFGRTTALLAPRMPSQNKKAIPYGMTFCFGGDKRDRTADLMTASCYRFVIWSVFASNTSVPSTKSAGFCKVLSIASTRFRAHLGHNLGQFFAAGYSLQSRR